MNQFLWEIRIEPLILIVPVAADNSDRTDSIAIPIAIILALKTPCYTDYYSSFNLFTRAPRAVSFSSIRS